VTSGKRGLVDRMGSDPTPTVEGIHISGNVCLFLWIRGIKGVFSFRLVNI
jgi:hypothetical protein